MEYEDRRTIPTPEGVELALPLAGLGSRFTAFLLDSLLQGTLIFTVAIFAALGGPIAEAIVLSLTVLFAVVGYDVLFEVYGAGRTPGKRAVGVRVVMDGGSPIGLRASLIRNVLRLVEGLATVYIPAIISILATRHNQRLGDLAAGTLVVRDPRPTFVRQPPLLRIDASAYASWDVAGIGDQELIAVRAYLARRTELDPSARFALAAELARRLRPRVAGVPAGLNDEVFLEMLAAAKTRH